MKIYLTLLEATIFIVFVVVLIVAVIINVVVVALLVGADPIIFRCDQ